jgi:hypothetical protein
MIKIEFLPFLRRRFTTPSPSSTTTLTWLLIQLWATFHGVHLPNQPPSPRQWNHHRIRPLARRPSHPTTTVCALPLHSSNLFALLAAPYGCLDLHLCVISVSIAPAPTLPNILSVSFAHWFREHNQHQSGELCVSSCRCIGFAPVLRECIHPYGLWFPCFSAG